MPSVNILFVCLGNICRSPTADGVFRQKVLQHRLNIAEQIMVDSAGTSDWHIGKQPDQRAQAAALSRGYDMSDLRARQAIPEDFQQFDYILAMDRQNLANLQAIQPANYAGHLGLLLDFLPENASVREVPDPYFGGPEGFDEVLDLIETASDSLLEHVIRQHNLEQPVD